MALQPTAVRCSARTERRPATALGPAGHALTAILVITARNCGDGPDVQRSRSRRQWQCVVVRCLSDHGRQSVGGAKDGTAPRVLLSIRPGAQGLQERERDGEDERFVFVADRHLGAGQACEDLDDPALRSRRQLTPMRENRTNQPHCVARTHHRCNSLAVTLLIRFLQAKAWRNPRQCAYATRRSSPVCATREPVCASLARQPDRIRRGGAAAAHVAHLVGGCIRRCIRLGHRFSVSILQARKPCDCRGDLRKQSFLLARLIRTNRVRRSRRRQLLDPARRACRKKVRRT